MILTVEPPPIEALDAGVIEEARRRQRLHRWMVAAAAAAAALALVLVLALGGGGSTVGGGSSTVGDGFAASGQPLKLSFRYGRPYVNGQPLAVGVTPTFTAGVVALDTSTLGNGQGGAAYPTSANPVSGSFSEGALDSANRPIDGAINATVVGPTVASMRVTHLGTFTPHRAVGLPLGEKVFVFSRRPGSRGTVIGPDSPAGSLSAMQQPALTETFYDASGNLIPSTGLPAFRVASRYWQAPATPAANGRCALNSTLAGVTVQWGEVATAIAPDKAVSGPAFMSCLETWYTWHGSSFDVGVLLNAESPGSAPAPLWYTTPVPGHPGIVEIKPVQVHRKFILPSLAALTRQAGHANADRRLATLEQFLKQAERSHVWQVLAPAAVARRVGSAWLVVRDGNSLAQRIQFLNGLHITRLNLSHA